MYFSLENHILSDRLLWLPLLGPLEGESTELQRGAWAGGGGGRPSHCINTGGVREHGDTRKALTAGRDRSPQRVNPKTEGRQTGQKGLRLCFPSPQPYTMPREDIPLLLLRSEHPPPARVWRILGGHSRGAGWGPSVPGTWVQLRRPLVVGL